MKLSLIALHSTRRVRGSSQVLFIFGRFPHHVTITRFYIASQRKGSKHALLPWPETHQCKGIPKAPSHLHIKLKRTFDRSRLSEEVNITHSYVRGSGSRHPRTSVLVTRRGKDSYRIQSYARGPDGSAPRAPSTGCVSATLDPLRAAPRQFRLTGQGSATRHQDTNRQFRMDPLRGTTTWTSRHFNH